MESASSRHSIASLNAVILRYYAIFFYSMQSALLQSFGEHISKAKLSKREIAQSAGVRPEMLSRLATQNACDTRTLEKLADALGLEIVFQPKQAAAAPSKAQRLGLSLPYDWSNAEISDIALIRKSIEYANLADLTRLAIQFGIDTLETEARRMPAHLTRAALLVLPNIRHALSSARASRKRTAHAA